MADTHSIAEPLTHLDREVLRAYVEDDRDALNRAAMAGYMGTAMEKLLARGYLRRHLSGMLVTPAGLAASLDT